MKALPILKMGNPRLRVTAAEVVDPTAPEIRELLAQMRISMEAAGGVGLAAPQIGVSKQVVIFSVPGARLEQEGDGPSDGIPETVLINPKITPIEEEQRLGWEGCLSVPGMRGLVPRYQKIRYEGVDQFGEKIDVEASGFHARVVQHEVDHLDGILCPERMTDLRHLVYESEMEDFMSAFDEMSGQKG